MIVRYAWDRADGEPPAVATWLDVSGDPDKLVLRGRVARHIHEHDCIELVIIMSDGQVGAVDFMNWLSEENTIGIKVSEAQGILG